MTSEISKSPDRDTSQRERYLERTAQEGRTPENDDTVKAMIEFFDSFDARRNQQEQDPAWRENNLEYDLRSSALIQEKCRASEIYSQHLYAALCNTDWQKLEVMPILKDQTWSCSWRYAGGIVADLRAEGDYIDWYCSGIKETADPSEEEWNRWSKEQQEYWTHVRSKFVGEATVTEEIRHDFRSLGWQQVDEDE